MQPSKKFFHTLSLRFFLLFSTTSGLLAGMLFAYLKLVSEIFEQEMDLIDTAALALVQWWQSPAMDAFMLFITLTGSPEALIILSLPILYWIYRQERRVKMFSLFFLSFAGGGVLNLLLKNLYQRERPLLDAAIGAYGYSLPSGHAMISTIFYGLVAYWFLTGKRRKSAKVLVGILCALMVFLIGMSRVYLQAHYFSDVLAGYLCGAMWLLACILVLYGRHWSRLTRGVTMG